MARGKSSSARRRGTGNRIIIPHGTTVLAEGDTVTAFGTGDSRIDLAYMLEPLPPSASEDE